MQTEELSNLLLRLRRPASSLPALAQLSEPELARLTAAIDSSCARHDRVIHAALTRTLPRALSQWLLQRARQQTP